MAQPSPAQRLASLEYRVDQLARGVKHLTSLMEQHVAAAALEPETPDRPEAFEADDTAADFPTDLSGVALARAVLRQRHSGAPVAIWEERTELWPVSSAVGP
jgi:hypothetical protein